MGNRLRTSDRRRIHRPLTAWRVTTITLRGSGAEAPVGPTANADSLVAVHHRVHDQPERTAELQNGAGDLMVLGANILGKPRVFLLYLGSVDTYRQNCAEAVANGFEEFTCVP